MKTSKQLEEFLMVFDWDACIESKMDMREIVKLMTHHAYIIGFQDGLTNARELLGKTLIDIISPRRHK